MLGGELSSHLLNVMLLTLLVAPLVLWRYRRAVLAGMLDRPGESLPLTEPEARPEPGSARAKFDEAALQTERRIRRRVFAAVLVAAFLAALPISALYLHLGDQPLTPAHLYLKAGVLASAGVPVFAVLTATPARRALALWLLTLAALAAVGVLLSMAQRPFYGKAPSFDQLANFVVFLQFAALTLWLPLLLGLLIGARRWRGVAPIVFAGLLIFGLAPLLGARLTQWLTATRSGAEWVLSGPGQEAGFLLIALPTGWLAWRRLKSLASGYEAKRFSDAQLLAQTWWVLVVAVDVVERVSAYPGTAALIKVLAVAAFALAIFPPLLAWTLGRALAGLRRPAPRTLLLLRVFGDTARSEGLFDRVASRWRWFGPVTMIAGPDVVARTVDPDDFLRFAAGDIASTFVNTQSDLERRLAALDQRPDPDGRYRINEFCCRDHSWQGTVVRLIDRADAVVMDLRGYGAGRAGCEFELGQLGRRCRPEQVVLLVDVTTDPARLEKHMREAGERPMSIVELPRGDAMAFDAAFAALLRAAA